MKKFLPQLANLVGYQAAWAACILGAANDAPHLGPLVSWPVVMIQLFFNPRWRGETLFLLASVAFGLMLDSLLVWAGFLEFKSEGIHLGIVPLWMVSLWAAFAGTLPRVLSWLSGRPFLAATFGLVGGPLAYYAGAHLGALEFQSDQVGTWFGVGLGYAVYCPVAANLARRVAPSPVETESVESVQAES